jgi:hypothetical protein
MKGPLRTIRYTVNSYCYSECKEEWVLFCLSANWSKTFLFRATFAAFQRSATSYNLKTTHELLALVEFLRRD